MATSATQTSRARRATARHRSPNRRPVVRAPIRRARRSRTTSGRGSTRTPPTAARPVARWTSTPCRSSGPDVSWRPMLGQALDTKLFRLLCHDRNLLTEEQIEQQGEELASKQTYEATDEDFRKFTERSDGY